MDLSVPILSKFSNKRAFEACPTSTLSISIFSEILHVGD